MKKTWMIIWSLLNFAFSGFLAQPLTDFIKKQFTEGKQADYGWLFDNRFSLLSFIIFALLFLGIFGLAVLVWRLLPANRHNRLENKIRKELEDFNNAYFQDVKIKAIWEVIPEGLWGDNPSVSNLQFFCMNEAHQPVVMQHGLCPYPGCPNHVRRVDEYKIKNMIESDLILKKQALRGKI